MVGEVMEESYIIARKKHKKYLLLFLLYLFVFIFIAVIIFLLNISIDKKLSLFLLFLIVMLVIIFWFKPRLFFYSQQTSFFRLKLNQEPPIDIVFSEISQNLLDHLKSKFYKIHVNENDLLILHRYTKDSTEFVVKNPMLEILVFIKNNDIPFNSKKITRSINDLEDYYLKNKINFRNYTILEFKYASSINSNQLKEIDDVTFDKQGSRHITVINTLVNRKSKKAYFLESQLSNPTIYYSYGVKLIKELLLEKNK
jgi:hypothetical protein